MDKLKSKTRLTRNRPAEATSSSLQPQDNSSTHAVNEGFLASQSGTAARDFAASNSPSEGVPAVEPPTSLQSSIDADAHVPKPSRYGDPSSMVTHGYVSSIVYFTQGRREC
jgi:hypothetical protein